MNNTNKTASKRKNSSMGTTFRRVFLGGLFGGQHEMTVADERYDSPTKLAVKRFFRKPLATGAVIVLCAMFLFVFIGPMIAPIDLSYTEVLHKNVAPTMSLMKLPNEMKQNPISISSRGTFTLGLDQNGKLHVWGYYDPLSNDPAKDVLNIPEEISDTAMAFAAAGSDHCIAIGEDGKIYAWGEDDLAQFGREGRMADLFEFTQPDELIDGTIDVSQVSQLICGNQVTAILMKDGTLYAWGNSASAAQNLGAMFDEIENGKVFKKICFTNTNLFAITEDGEFVVGKNKQYDLYNGESTWEHIGDRKVLDIAATGDSIALLLEDGEVMSMGAESKSPVIPDGETAVALSAGTRHFTLETDKGSIVAWGNGRLGQTDIPEELTEPGAVDRVISTGFQNYAFKDGEYVDSFGLNGYIFGTDELGRDIFNRVMNGGRMTMTIGAVAVIVSTIIGIIIGCISGYFGGIVDMLLMRITEIFSSIPFLPFALVLSAILQASNLKEDTRIFIIMIILGILSWTGLARLVRGQILSEREKEFVTAAKSMGIKESRIAFKHILPNVISVILVSVTLDFATCMLTETSLSYLGFGVMAPRPTWGNMLNGCNNSIVIQNYWWRWLFPAIFLAVTVICINIIGDTLRDVLDPKSEVEK